MSGWGDSLARALLGMISLGLLVSAALSKLIQLSPWLAGPFLVFGLIFAVLCAFYRDLDGHVTYRMFTLRFWGPGRGQGQAPDGDEGDDL
jgi:ABC-type polysaccharide/polyol phosphate export permease